MAPYKVQKLPENDRATRIIREEMENEFCDGFVLVGDEETCLSGNYEKYAETIKNFEVRDSDIIVCSYPKTGTTWTQEMVWMIVNDLDFEGAKANLAMKCPFLEVCTIYNFEKMNNYMETKFPNFLTNSIDFSKHQKDPRFIRTHFPFYLLPDHIQTGKKSPKMIYVVRNPKDVCVSFYHHSRIIQGHRTTLENFAEVFLANKALYGSFWKHVFGFWKHRNSPNLLFITYEDMKRDLPSVIKKVAKFLDKELTEEQIEKLCKHLSFESMKQNKAVNLEDFVECAKKLNLATEEGAFIRSGTVGKHKEEMSPELIERFNVWIKENTAGTSFEQEYHYIL